MQGDTSSGRGGMRLLVVVAALLGLLLVESSAWAKVPVTITFDTPPAVGAVTASCPPGRF